jgi:hypothetical protein
MFSEDVEMRGALSDQKIPDLVPKTFLHINHVHISHESRDKNNNIIHIERLDIADVKDVSI